jgi:MoaA/NifB/PqqE/SkfB family radical SAM enzyme
LTNFDYNTIDEYQLEITTNCNASCPQCPRNDLGGKLNPYMDLVNLPRDVIDRAFTTELCGRLRQVFFCGSYGDPIVHPDFLDILRDFRSKNPTLWLYVHTNGGAHNTEYWREMAEIMNGYGQVDFGIDGLEDTLHLYRKNVNYNKVIENAEAFISAGGRAMWQMIVFKHNEHQVKEAEKLATDMNFFKFLARKTGRFFHHGEERELDSWPVKKMKGETEYYFEPPVNNEWRNQSVIKLPELKKQYKDLQQYFKTTDIHCDSLHGKKVAMNAQGVLLPCNFFNHNLYDARFRTGVLPGSNQGHTVDGRNQVTEFLNQYGLDNLSIHNYTIEEIYENKFWSDLVDSWTGENRIFECAMTCGRQFTKVWDQTK